MNPITKAIVNTITSLRRTAIGAQVIGEWLGDGAEPVPQVQAESRASICVTCPMNIWPSWWEQHSNKIALWIRNALEYKKSIGLRVTCENALHLCRVCKCALPLKVHVPIEHIKSHTSAEEFSKLPSFCWIVTEIV